MKILLKCIIILHSILILCCLAWNKSNAQVARTDLKIPGGNNYDIEVALNDGIYNIRIAQSGKKSFEQYPVSNFTSKVLHNLVFEYYKKMENPVLPVSSENLDALRGLTDLRFIELITALFNSNEPGQLIATIVLMNEVKVEGVEGEKAFYANTCQIVFEDGFIKSIIATGTIDDKKISFSNSYAIGLTTRANVRHLEQYLLFNENSKDDKRSIKVGDLLQYSRILGIKTNDFSPADVAILLTPGNEETLSKSPSAKLFTLNIFSDFVGINQENPNGLIQTEFSKRINVFTRRWAFMWRPSWAGIGYFTHISPQVEITKVEQNNRSLELSSFQLNDSTTRYYSSPLEIYRHSVAKVSTELNVFDIQGAGLNLFINGFLGMGITDLKDTIPVDEQLIPINETVNTLLTGLNAKVIFNPESRWSYQIKSSTIFSNNLNYRINYSSPTEGGVLTSANKWIHSAELLLAWNTGSDNKLFGRFRFNHEWREPRNNFSQFQIGYSTLLKVPAKERK